MIKYYKRFLIGFLMDGQKYLEVSYGPGLFSDEYLVDIEVHPFGSDYSVGSQVINQSFFVDKSCINEVGDKKGLVGLLYSKEEGKRSTVLAKGVNEGFLVVPSRNIVN